jgi:hypothetical protein
VTVSLPTTLSTGHAATETNALLSMLYDAEGTVTPDGAVTCVGLKCFYRTFIVFLSSAGVATVLAVVLLRAKAKSGVVGR